MNTQAVIHVKYASRQRAAAPAAAQANLLLRADKAAAVDRPQVAGDVGVLRVARRHIEARIQPDEIERGADPGDAGDDVRPAQDQTEPVGEIDVDGHR
jgi:hypothetical protein